MHRRQYFILGGYAAMQVAQGVCGCPIFADPVFSYCTYGKMLNVGIPTDQLTSSIKAIVHQVREHINQYPGNGLILCP